MLEGIAVMAQSVETVMLRRLSVSIICGDSVPRARIVSSVIPSMKDLERSSCKLPMLLQLVLPMPLKVKRTQSEIRAVAVVVVVVVGEAVEEVVDVEGLETCLR